MADRDWFGWHEAYDEAGSPLARRLATVQARVGAALTECPAGAVRVLSVCAGQGRDLIDVLRSHPRRRDVVARLVELDPRNAAAARDAVRAAGLGSVEVREADAARLGEYRDLAPAQLVLLCGVFGNIDDDDIRRTVRHCTQLCDTGGFVVWTRHRRPPDLVPGICGWFAEQGFEQRWLSAADEECGVGVHRYTGAPVPLVVEERMFVFNRSADGARVPG